MSHEPDSVPPLHWLEPLVVNLEQLALEGRLLDIGGGGEGIIGRLGGDRVIAIDASHRELEEARTYLEQTLPEEARQAGALPGWLRE